MIILGTNSIKDTGYDVGNSVRMSGANVNLQRDFSGDGNRRTWTYSTWFKLSKITQSGFFNWGKGNPEFSLRFESTTSDASLNQFRVSQFDGSQPIDLVTTQYFRDPSAWGHMVVAFDTTQGTASNRIKIYFNGTQITSFSTETYPDQNFETFVNQASKKHYIGYADYQPINGYLCETVFIDGQQLAPDQFGEFDEDSGIWKPINVSGLTFGTNGYYLEYKEAGTGTNASGIGADTSGGTNHFAVDDVVAIDQMVDTPTNNFATFNPLVIGEPTATFLGYAEGNLQGSSAGGVSANTILLPTSGKWFVEYHFNNASGNSDPGVGFWSIDTSQATRWYQSGFKGLAWKYNAAVYLNGSNSFSATSFTSGDIISIAVDMDNNRVTFYKNGSAVSNLTNYSFDFTVSLGNFTVGYVDGANSSTYDTNVDMNAGQNGTFNGRKTAGGNSDGDGYGNFSMSVPSGYYALNTKNLAEYG